MHHADNAVVVDFSRFVDMTRAIVVHSDINGVVEANILRDEVEKIHAVALPGIWALQRLTVGIKLFWNYKRCVLGGKIDSELPIFNH